MENASRTKTKVQIKRKKTQLIFLYLKTAKEGMLNILNQCQDRNYVAYRTFYTPAKTQTFTTRYKSETNEEEISNDDVIPVPGYNANFKAQIYKLDSPRYIPYV